MNSKKPLTTAQKRTLAYLREHRTVGNEGWIDGFAVPGQRKVLRDLIELGLVEKTTIAGSPEYRALGHGPAST